MVEEGGEGEEGAEGGGEGVVEEVQQLWDTGWRHAMSGTQDRKVS